MSLTLININDTNKIFFVMWFENYILPMISWKPKLYAIILVYNIIALIYFKFYFNKKLVVIFTFK